MGAEKVSRFIVEVGGDDADIRSVLRGLKSEFASTIADLQQTSKRLELFEGLGDRVKAAGDALQKAKADAAALAEQLDKVQKSGEKASAELVAQNKAAQQEVAKTTTEYNRAVDAISKMQGQLSKAGVDTRNLGTEQQRLATALKAATDAQKQQEAAQTLGLKTTASIAPEIAKINQAYQTLAASGTLTGRELVTAQQLALDKTSELRGSVTGVGTSLTNVATTAKSGAPGLLGFFADTLLPAAGLTLNLAAIAAGLLTVFNSAQALAREIKQGTAEIGQATNLTKDQLKQLEDGAKDLATTVGIDVVDALKQLKEIIRSTGAEPDDAIAILKTSALAAKAGLADLNVTTKISTDLISGYGVAAGDLPRIFDGIIAGAKAGGPTLEQFGQGIGSLSVAAKAANVSLPDLTAFLNVMTSATGDASGSVNTLQRLLLAFNTEKVQQGLRDIGIEARDFTGVMKELADKGIPVDKLIDLGVAGSKSALGVEALTRNSKDLTDALDRQAGSAGLTGEALKQFYESPKGRAEEFDKQLQKSNLLLADIFGSGSFWRDGLTRALTDINFLVGSFVRLTPAQIEAKVAADNAAVGFVGVADAAKIAAAEQTAYTKATADSAASIKQLRAELSGIADRLIADVKALSDATAAQLAQVSKAADAEIAALDKSSAATLKTAEETVRIQAQASLAKLKIIQDNEKEVTRITNEAIAAREASLRKTTDNETKIQADLAKIRLESIKPTIAAYQGMYDALVSQAQGWASKVESLEKGRFEFNESIEKRLFDIRIAGLDSFDQYYAKSKEIDRLVSLSREAAAKGDVDNAKKYGEQAITLANTLTTSYTLNGITINKAADTQATKLGTIKGVADAVNTAYEKAGDAAKTGADNSKEQLEKVERKLKDLLAIQKDMETKAAAGLKYQVAVDEKSYKDTKDKLDALSKDRTVNLIINEIRGGSSSGDFVGPPSPITPVRLAGGGGVGSVPVRGYAGGGGVWKVPGSGDGDTVPAWLRVGSYVLRKAASMRYGGMLGQMMRGYAGGGPVFGIGPGDDGGIGTGKGFDLGVAELAFGYKPEKRKAIEEPKEWADLRQVKIDAGRGLSELKGKAQGLQRSSIGQNIGDYLGRLLEAIVLAQTPAEAHAFWDPISGELEEIAAAIANGIKRGVPVTRGIVGKAPVAGDKPAPKVDDPALQPWTDSKGVRIGGGAPSGSIHFAAGGAVGTDIVPAMLTPGEEVIQPEAVSWGARMFGSGIWDALNNMRLPDFDFAAIVPRPPPMYFGEGGRVPGGAPSISQGNSAPAGGYGSPVEFHFHGVDISNPSELRRVILPVWRDIDRRSKK